MLPHSVFPTEQTYQSQEDQYNGVSRTGNISRNVKTIGFCRVGTSSRDRETIGIVGIIGFVAGQAVGIEDRVSTVGENS
jgi:hypothetical protein